MSKAIRAILITVVVLLVVIAIVGVPLLYGWARGAGFNRFDFMGPRMMTVYGFSWVGLIPRFLIGAAIISGIVWFIWVLARTGSRSGNLPTTESPLDILKRRYARGEITKEQFDEMKRNLGV